MLVQIPKSTGLWKESRTRGNNIQLDRYRVLDTRNKEKNSGIHSSPEKTGDVILSATISFKQTIFYLQNPGYKTSCAGDLFVETHQTSLRRHRVREERDDDRDEQRRRGQEVGARPGAPARDRGQAPEWEGDVRP
jgi:hypothetical protein